MIYVYVPYFNEELLARIRVKEDSTWVNEAHVMEADRTFKYGHKKLN